ncbi:MAG: DNA polymerase clamp loader subunit A [Nitrososphaerales archaeon]|nr:DNA polymerase clamp loader subunit A [Nitrososphaerales archaeon]
MSIFIMEIFDYLNDIGYKKENILKDGDEIIEAGYQPYRINKFLSQHIDCLFLANDMNFHNHIDNKLQFDYFINTIRKKFRQSSKWLKAEQVDEIDLIKEYYNYNNSKAKEVLNLLSEKDIEFIKRKLRKGGLK